jgi:hypothetical protein
MAIFYGSLYAQTQKTVTLRMHYAKSGKLISTTHFLVRINHEKEIHGNWVDLNEDGTGKLSLPAGATDLTVQATYDSAMETFVNCDSAATKGYVMDRWYAVSEILATGVVAPNGCLKPQDAKKLKFVAKPGEFVFFVRPRSKRELSQDDASQ